MDLVSETGTYSPDWLSQQKDWLPDEDRKVWEDHSSEFRSKMDKLPKPSDVDASKVIIHNILPNLNSSHLLTDDTLTDALVDSTASSLPQLVTLP